MAGPAIALKGVLSPVCPFPSSAWRKTLVAVSVTLINPVQLPPIKSTTNGETETFR